MKSATLAPTGFELNIFFQKYSTLPLNHQVPFIFKVRSWLAHKLIHSLQNGLCSIWLLNAISRPQKEYPWMIQMAVIEASHPVCCILAGLVQPKCYLLTKVIMWVSVTTSTALQDDWRAIHGSILHIEVFRAQGRFGESQSRELLSLSSVQ
jgi:hypothetical protein